MSKLDTKDCPINVLTYIGRLEGLLTFAQRSLDEYVGEKADVDNELKAIQHTLSTSVDKLFKEYDR